MSDISTDSVNEQIHDLVFDYPEYFTMGLIEQLNKLVGMGELLGALELANQTVKTKGYKEEYTDVG